MDTPGHSLGASALFPGRASILDEAQVRCGSRQTQTDGLSPHPGPVPHRDTF